MKKVFGKRMTLGIIKNKNELQQRTELKNSNFRIDQRAGKLL